MRVREAASLRRDRHPPGRGCGSGSGGLGVAGGGSGRTAFYTGFVRTACPKRLVKRVIARTADVSVGYPHVNWSASLSYSVFLIARTPHGLVGWAQMH
jgi:hypothetical protein